MHTYKQLPGPSICMKVRLPEASDLGFPYMLEPVRLSAHEHANRSHVYYVCIYIYIYMYCVYVTPREMIPSTV